MHTVAVNATCLKFRLYADSDLTCIDFVPGAGDIAVMIENYGANVRAFSAGSSTSQTPAFVMTNPAGKNWTLVLGNVATSVRCWAANSSCSWTLPQSTAWSVSIVLTSSLVETLTSGGGGGGGGGGGALSTGTNTGTSIIKVGNVKFEPPGAVFPRFTFLDSFLFLIGFVVLVNGTPAKGALPRFIGPVPLQLPIARNVALALGGAILAFVYLSA